MANVVNNLTGFGAINTGLRATLVAVGSLSSTTTTFNITTNHAMSVGKYVIVITARHTTGTGSRNITGAGFVPAAGYIAATELVDNNRVSGGTGNVAVYGFDNTTINETGVDVQVTTNTNVHSVAVWIYRIDGLRTVVSTVSTGSSDGGSYTLTTSSIRKGIAFYVGQGDAGITNTAGIGSAVKDSTEFSHETGGVGQCFVVSNVERGLGATSITFSTAFLLSAGVVLGE